MSFEEEFDDIIRQKSDELHFPFDEKNWDKASGMINAQRQAAAPNNYRKLVLPALALLFVGSAVIIGLNYTAPALKPEKNNPIALHEAKHTTVVSPAEETALKTSNTATIKQPVAETANENLSGTPVKKTPSSLNTSDATAAAIPHTNASVKKSNTQPPALATPVQKNTNTVPKADGSNPGIEEALPVSRNNDETFASGDKALNPAATVAEDKDQKNKMPADHAIAVNDRSGTKNNTMPGPAANSGKVTASDPGNAHADNKPIVENTTAGPAVEQLPVIPVSPVAGPEQELAQTPLVYLKRYDEDYYQNSTKPKTHFLNAEFGGTYMLGWDTKAGRDGKGMDWFGGFNYGVYITKKISISAGLQAYSIQHIDEAFYTNKKMAYGFGSVASNTIITSNNLYYAAIPVKIHYAINKENQFAVGANFGYMLNSGNTIETYDILDNAKVNYSKVKNSGVYTGANSMNIMLSASYRYEIKSRVHLTGEFIYGISDIFKNTRTIKNNEQPKGIRLSLQYTLFDK